MTKLPPLPDCDCLLKYEGPTLHRPGCPRAIALHVRAGRKVPRRHRVKS